MLGSRLAAAAVALTLGLSAPTAAQDEASRAQAREHFNAGVQRYEQGDYQGALEAFQEAYRLAPHPMVRVNMANCYEHLGRPLEALHHFERFLAESQSATRQQRREVQAAIARLGQQLAEVRLSIAPDGALVTIDGAETRRAPILEPVRLTAGAHRIEVRLDGYRTDRREIQVTGGQAQRITIQLERGSEGVAAATPPAAAVTQPPATTAEPAAAAAEPAAVTDGATGEPAQPAVAATVEPDTIEEPSSAGGGDFQLRITTPVIIGASVTAAFTVAAIISGAIALKANSDFDTYVSWHEESPLTPDEHQQALAAADTANTASILTDVFIIGAIAGAGVTAFFLIIDGMGEEPGAVAGDLRLRVSPVATRDGGGLVLGGSF